MGARDIVVIGASAGGVTALLELARGLPHDLPASLFITVHSSPDSPGYLPELLTRAGRLPASHGVNGERFRHGHIYVAPPDRHLLLNAQSIKVTRGPHENGFRPAVDPLFRSAAEGHGNSVIGIILSGGLDDGTLGLGLIKRHGGVAIAQDVRDAVIPSMPASAIHNVDVDHVVKARELPALLTQLVAEPGPERKQGMTRNAANREARRSAAHALQEHPPRGELSAFTCPGCGGALWETPDGKLMRFACHVGHRYTAESLMKGQDDGIEEALWSALRALEEKAALRRRMASHARRGRLDTVARQYDAHASESETQAERIRAVLINGDQRANVAELAVPGKTARRKSARATPQRMKRAARGRAR